MLKYKKAVIISAVCIAIVAVAAVMLSIGAASVKTNGISMSTSIILDGNQNNLAAGDIVSIAEEKVNPMQQLQYVKISAVATPSKNDIYDDLREGVNYVQNLKKPVKFSLALSAQQKEAFSILRKENIKLNLICRSNDSRAQNLLKKQSSMLVTASSSVPSQAGQAASMPTKSAWDKSQAGKPPTVTERQAALYDEQMGLLTQ